jgi:hypothetical protein
MHLSTLLLFSACAAAAPTLASAQATRSSPAAASVQAADEAREALSQVQVGGQAHRHRLDADDARKIRGTYALSNGWTMQVTPQARRVFIAINDGAPIELLPQSADRFATADGNIATVFNRGAWEDEVVMSYVTDARLSDQRVIVGSGTMAAR